MAKFFLLMAALVAFATTLNGLPLEEKSNDPSSNKPQISTFPARIHSPKQSETNSATSSDKSRHILTNEKPRNTRDTDSKNLHPRPSSDEVKINYLRPTSGSTVNPDHPKSQQHENRQKRDTSSTTETSVSSSTTKKDEDKRDSSSTTEKEENTDAHIQHVPHLLGSSQDRTRRDTHQPQSQTGGNRYLPQGQTGHGQRTQTHTQPGAHTRDVPKSTVDRNQRQNQPGAHTRDVPKSTVDKNQRQNQPGAHTRDVPKSTVDRNQRQNQPGAHTRDVPKSTVDKYQKH